MMTKKKVSYLLPPPYYRIASSTAIKDPPLPTATNTPKLATADTTDKADTITKCYAATGPPNPQPPIPRSNPPSLLLMNTPQLLRPLLIQQEGGREYDRHYKYK